MAAALKHHFVFIGTSTDEKIRDFNIAAQARGLPVHFFNLKQIAGTFHNVDEVGLSAAANANAKQKNIAPQKDALRKHPERVAEYLAKHGYLRDKADFSPSRAWFAAEDSGLSLPKEIWQHIDTESLNPEVRDRMLSQATPAPGVETAPVLSGWLGARNMYTNIVNAIDRAKKQSPSFKSDDLVFNELSWLNMENMADPAKVFDSHGSCSNYFNYANEAFKQSPRFTTYDFVRPTDKISYKSQRKGKITAKDLGVDFIAHHSARRNALLNMVTKINATRDSAISIYRPEKETSEDRAHMHEIEPNLLLGMKHTVAGFDVGIMNGEGSALAPILQAQLQAEHFHAAHLCKTFEAPLPESTDYEKAYHIISYPERVLQNNDGIILMPDEGNPHPMSLKEKLYTLNSLVVAKQLAVRDMEKTFIIINSDHSWDEATQIHNSLANANLTKDHVIPLSPQMAGVEIESNGYFHMINGGNREACTEAAVTLMKDKAFTYHRHANEVSEPFERGTPPAPNKRSAAIFCSASCENTPLNKMVSDLSSQLADKDIAIKYGGSDRYTMGAVLSGVKRSRTIKRSHGPLGHISGFSTAPIVKAETKEGKFPEELDYTEQTKDIYARMVKMLEADSVVVTAGGAGSLQEWMAAEILKERMKEHYGHKKLVILDADLMPEPRSNEALGAKQFGVSHVYDTILRTVYKDQYYDLALPNLHRGNIVSKKPARSDLFLVRTVDEAVKTLMDSQNPVIGHPIRKASSFGLAV